MIKRHLKSLARRLPGIGTLADERDELAADAAKLRRKVESLQAELSVWKKGFVPPGHFYSPIPDFDALPPCPRQSGATLDVPGIDLRPAAQLALVETFAAFEAELPFPERPTAGHRYHLDNDFYAHSDGVCLYAMLRHLRPGKLLEVGSGYSSAAALDTRDHGLDPDMEFLFVDPYPERLESLLTDDDRRNGKLRIERRCVQDLPMAEFRSLRAGDVLFVDSSHVSRVHSDVNFLLFDVLPALNPGVHVHVHDIFFPFEYPDSWTKGGRAWNELYLLRAFLQFNDAFEVTFFNSYLEQAHRDLIARKMPRCLRVPTNPATIPGSLWLRKAR